MPNKLIAFRNSYIQNECEKRNGQGEVASRDLERYYRLLQQAKWEMKLTFDEAMLLCDAFNGVMIDYSLPIKQVFLLDLKEAIEYEKLDTKYQVDKLSFLEKLDKMDSLVILAILDSIELFWMGSYSKSSNEVRSQIIRCFNLDELVLT